MPADKNLRAKFRSLQDAGFGELPICIAKTQYHSPPTRASAAIDINENGEVVGLF